jgi:hypothetical protein
MHMQDIYRSSLSRPMAILTLALGRYMDERHYLAGGLQMLTHEAHVYMSAFALQVPIASLPASAVERRRCRHMTTAASHQTTAAA